MTRWASILYRDFWDFPHIFVFADRGQTYLFDCPFDEDTEDYAEEFAIYLMPSMTLVDLKGSWAGLRNRAIADLGRVPTTSVRFDPTKRQFVDPSIVDSLLAHSAFTPG